MMSCCQADVRVWLDIMKKAVVATALIHYKPIIITFL